MIVEKGEPATKYFNFNDFVNSAKSREKTYNECESVRQKCRKILDDAGYKAKLKETVYMLHLSSPGTWPRINCEISNYPSMKIIKIRNLETTKHKAANRPKGTAFLELGTNCFSSQNIFHCSEGDTEFPTSKNDEIKGPLRLSLFPNVSPYLNFQHHQTNKPNSSLLLKWGIPRRMSTLVQATLKNSGFDLIPMEQSKLKTPEHLWGRQNMFKVQRMMYFPGNGYLVKKDLLWYNFKRLKAAHGCNTFSFVPECHILPQDADILKRVWKARKGKQLWILKPPGSSRGRGVKVVKLWSELPSVRQPLVVQKYIANPFLINESKFDLRLYVLVTSFDPLRIYLYSDGFARFATSKYSEDYKDPYSHLTNYCINRHSSQYKQNTDPNTYQGHKWTLKKFLEFMGTLKIDSKMLWNQLKDLVIKTIISGEESVFKACKDLMDNRYDYYELFGMDVLLDDDMKFWLLEVNSGPALESAQPVDSHVKGPMIKTMLDLAQYQLPKTFKEKTGHKIPQDSGGLAFKEQQKQNLFMQYEYRDRLEYLDRILEDLTWDDVKHLIQAEDELVAKGQFERIFPTNETYRYLRFINARYYNRLFDAWENQYNDNRAHGIALLRDYCATKITAQSHKI